MPRGPKGEKRAAPPPKSNKNLQYERFLETARELGVGDKKSGEAFEDAFGKIVPPKQPKSPS